MCGRFTLRTPTKDIVRTFGLAEAPELKPRYNIAPTQQIAAIKLDPETGTRQLPDVPKVPTKHLPFVGAVVKLNCSDDDCTGQFVTRHVHDVVLANPTRFLLGIEPLKAAIDKDSASDCGCGGPILNEFLLSNDCFGVRLSNGQGSHDLMPMFDDSSGIPFVVAVVP